MSVIFLNKTWEQLALLGVPASYKGCYFASYAVELCLETPDRLLLITKWVYLDVAKKYRTNWMAVERNLRTVAKVAWKNNRILLEEMVRKPLPAPPTVTELISALCRAVLDDDHHPWV